MPVLNLHPDLRRDLSQALVNRVSFYGIIHDINKEMMAMLANDCCAASIGDKEDATSPLVLAATQTQSRSSPMEQSQEEALRAAVIDEEEWLLSTIASREPAERQEQLRACPETFLQAMGEKEYENPVASLAGNTRTQLWKPSRSWWEAKSGKNPWIEPTSHNKRWRYLWPLIHYHKFLAKCIKKLKRNSVDVKQSVSPVAVFLREEVCAVSDHLASLSLFDSDEWMACLSHFNGWTDSTAEDAYRSCVAKLKLRSVKEPGDVDSPLLRSQIDEQFLRSMAAARDQLREVNAEEQPKSGQPPVYPRSSPVPKHIHSKPADHQRRTRAYPQYPSLQQQQPIPQQHALFYPPPQHLYQQQQQWDPSQAAAAAAASTYCDTSSVHSALSGDSYAHQQQPPPALLSSQPPQVPLPMPPHMYHPMASYYHYPVTAPDASTVGGYSHGPNAAVYDPHQVMQSGWVDPSLMYAMHMEQQQQQTHGAFFAQPPSVAPVASPKETSRGKEPTTSSRTPKKSPSDMPSPFWSHLDQATLAMGLATPAKASPPSRNEGYNHEEDESESSNAATSGFLNAQPLFLQGHYYGAYTANTSGAYGSREGYGPPSPATQFMMSPQANFYNYGYGGVMTSPARKKSSPRKPTMPEVSSPPLVRKVSPVEERASPSTVDTLAETESLHEG